MTTMDGQMEVEWWVSHSLHLRGYLLNHGRRWHASLINVRVRNANTASGATVAIADKAKVYILTRLRHLATLLTLTARCPSSGPRKNTALCLGLLKGYLFLTTLGGNITKDIWGSSQSMSSPPSIFSNFYSGVTSGKSHLVDNQLDSLPHSRNSGNVYLSAEGCWGLTPERKVLLTENAAWERYCSAYLLAFDRNQWMHVFPLPKGDFSAGHSTGYVLGLFS